MPPIRDHTFLYKFIADEDEEKEKELLLKEELDEGGERERERERERDREDEDADDDDTDMPPLVDRPPAGTHTQQPQVQTQESMMSSIDFTGITFPPAVFNPTTTLVYAAEEDDGRIGVGRGRSKAQHAPSYIPRPPNAFILFRSSFIRSQNVPERVEGNNSTLSKIIGKYWHALPPDERAKWEDKARAAQAEHRRRYPDWRFRPSNGKNSKPKGRRKGRIKGDQDEDDRNEPPDEKELEVSVPRGRRAARSRDPKGKGKGKAVERDLSWEEDRPVKRRGKGKEKDKDKDKTKQEEGDDDARNDKI
ncbi:hypothetical protein C8F01DRAFT_1019248, partial [Mycena amicta]